MAYEYIELTAVPPFNTLGQWNALRHTIGAKGADWSLYNSGTKQSRLLTDSELRHALTFVVTAGSEPAPPEQPEEPVTGTISGPSSSAVQDSPATFTVSASAYPVYAVLYSAGADVGSRVAVNGAGTVDLTPLTQVSHTARIYDASSGGNLVDDTPAFTPSAPVVVNPRYFGTSATTSLNDAGILALSNDSVNSKAKTLTLSQTDQYVYFAYPAALGVLTAWYIDDSGHAINQIGGLPHTTRTITPAGGSPTSYHIYQSENLLGDGSPHDYEFV